jgi:hypothetical protein
VQSSRALPWVLTVHFEHYPIEEILQCNTDPANNFEAVKILFSETMKQVTHFLFLNIFSFCIMT